MPVDTFKYGKTTAEVVIEHLIDEIKAVKPFIDNLTGAYCDRKCIAAWDLLENLRLAAENLAEEIIFDPTSHWDCDPRRVRREIEQTLDYPDRLDQHQKEFWKGQRSNLCTCEVCRRETQESVSVS
jgi:hypothetical protein